MKHFSEKELREIFDLCIGWPHVSCAYQQNELDSCVRVFPLIEDDNGAKYFDPNRRFGLGEQVSDEFEILPRLLFEPDLFNKGALINYMADAWANKIPKDSKDFFKMLLGTAWMRNLPVPSMGRLGLNKEDDYSAFDEAFFEHIEENRVNTSEVQDFIDIKRSYCNAIFWGPLGVGKRQRAGQEAPKWFVKLMGLMERDGHQMKDAYEECFIIAKDLAEQYKTQEVINLIDTVYPDGDLLRQKSGKYLYDRKEKLFKRVGISPIRIKRSGSAEPFVEFGRVSKKRVIIEMDQSLLARAVEAETGCLGLSRAAAEYIFSHFKPLAFLEVLPENTALIRGSRDAPSGLITLKIEHSKEGLSDREYDKYMEDCLKSVESLVDAISAIEESRMRQYYIDNDESGFAKNVIEIHKKIMAKHAILSQVNHVGKNGSRANFKV